MPNRQAILEIINRHGANRQALLTILEEIQAKYAHIAPATIQIIAEQTKISVSEIYSVGSFYSYLNVKAPEQYTISLCKNVSCCFDNDYQAVQQALEQYLQIKFDQTTADGKFTLKFTDCLGMCDQGPAMMINEQMYTKLTPETIDTILTSYKNKTINP